MRWSSFMNGIRWRMCSNSWWQMTSWQLLSRAQNQRVQGRGGWSRSKMTSTPSKSGRWAPMPGRGPAGPSTWAFDLPQPSSTTDREPVGSMFTGQFSPHSSTSPSTGFPPSAQIAYQHFPQPYYGVDTLLVPAGMDGERRRCVENVEKSRALVPEDGKDLFGAEFGLGFGRQGTAHAV